MALKAVFQEIFQLPFANDGLTYLPDTVSFVKVEKGFGKTIDLVRSFLLQPIDSIVRTKSFEMTWFAGGLEMAGTSGSFFPNRYRENSRVSWALLC
jgi:hypothetical protein